jgi:two-component system, OmpR family, sensor histidine kinase KdpD
VTHDLRTPLTSIKVSVTTLLDELRAPAAGDRVPLAAGERAELLEVIDEETDRLDRFVGNLVELARIEAGALQLRRRPTAVGEIVAQALGRSERHAKTHPVEARVDEGAPPVHGDGRALAEVLNALVDNAAKYSPAGSPIELSARADGEGVLIAVEDRGPGVPEALRERVFEKFFRFVPEERSTGEHPSGTGMGLSIARGIIEAHGGRVWIEAGAGGAGTRACVWLPAAPSDAEQRATAPLDGTPRRARSSPRGGEGE